MIQANKVDRAFTILQDRFRGSLGSVFREVFQEGVACSQWQKSQRDAFHRFSPREDAIENFMSRAIAADCKKLPVALGVGLSRKLNGVARAC